MRLNPFVPVALLLYGASALAAGDPILEEVIVTATLREQSLLEAPTSVTLLDARKPSVVKVASLMDRELVSAAAPPVSVKPLVRRLT